MKSAKNIPKVVVVGSGFAGIEIIKSLRACSAPVEIILVTKKRMFEYYPALYKLVTGALPIEVSVPIHVIFPGTSIQIIEAHYTGVDQNRQVITTTDSAGTTAEVAYDYLILALGSETNYFNIKGLPELSHSFKSVGAALKLKQHFCELFSKAKDLTKEELVSMLHVIIVGGGPSGVELAGDLRSYLTRVARDFKVDPSLVTIDLIEANNRVLPTMPEPVSMKAEARLRKMGVNIFVNRALASQEVEEVILKDMSMSSHTVIWTAGTRINSAYLTIPNVTFDERKRVVVSPMLSLPTDNHIFIAGDGAATPYSGLAQTAIHHGKFIAQTINALVRGKAVQPYQPKQPAFVIPIGVHWAVVTYKKFLMTGFLPWILRSAVDFRYFFQTVPLHYVFVVFKKGRKYRKVHGGCPIDGGVAHE
ncbi:MAG: FAD-dependent oxidoreductase [Candidatus Pacebacteria bacterium]|jgi:NADH dehydrogenase|nr:FAD-dependent oxidoreductase [Candidatus Paceibacterota bacterium]